MRILLIVLLVFAAASCGVRNKKGHCRDYRPVCLSGNATRVCELSPDGCTWCTCVSRAQRAEDQD